MSGEFRKPYPMDERNLLSNMSSKPKLPQSDVHRTTLRSHYKFPSFASLSRDSLASSISSLNSSREQLFYGTNMKINTGVKMSFLEDVNSHKISSEVMKQRLYESVLTSTRRRRFSSHQAPYDVSQSYHQVIQSLPVTPARTPAHSKRSSPLSSPRSSRFFNQNNDDMCIDEDDEPTFTGLTSLLKPSARFIPRSTIAGDRNDAVADFEQRLKNYPSSTDLTITSPVDGPSPAKRRQHLKF